MYYPEAPEVEKLVRFLFEAPLVTRLALREGLLAHFTDQLTFNRESGSYRQLARRTTQARLRAKFLEGPPAAGFAVVRHDPAVWDVAAPGAFEPLEGPLQRKGSLVGVTLQDLCSTAFFAAQPDACARLNARQDVIPTDEYQQQTTALGAQQAGARIEEAVWRLWKKLLPHLNGQIQDTPATKEAFLEVLLRLLPGCLGSSTLKSCTWTDVPLPERGTLVNAPEVGACGLGRRAKTGFKGSSNRRVQRRTPLSLPAGRTLARVSSPTPPPP